MSDKKFEGATLGSMEDFSRNLEDSKEVLIHNLTKLAELQKLRFDTLIAVGFSESQAIKLCATPVPIP
ncbi:MAG: hypothetical protein DSY80_05420 [Desulfocapsa sp.]|nr:MAG: hypothetical protein DSY80_05420 [Desulfocapsa sp.]